MAEIGAEPEQMNKVLVAIDESECSKYALKWALENIDDKLKSGVLLLSVAPLDYSGAFAGGYGSIPFELMTTMQELSRSYNRICILPFLYAAFELMTTMQENQKKFATALLANAKQICETYGVEAETLYVMGNPKDAICDTVEKFRCRLLVMGSHSRGAFGRAFLGSVSNYCVHNAKCPVLVVRERV